MQNCPPLLLNSINDWIVYEVRAMHNWLFYYMGCGKVISCSKEDGLLQPFIVRGSGGMLSQVI